MLAKKIKQKFQNNQVSFGAWVSIGHESIGEIFALAGFDWVLVETEHTAIDNSETLRILMAIENGGSVAMVRLSGIDPIQAKILLDSGAGGIIVPMVKSVEDAEKSVSMTKYPPLGERGVGLARAHKYGKDFNQYISNANKDSLLILQIEHIEAVDRIDEILSVEGIDGVFIGPFDLSMSMGVPGEIENPEVLKAMDRVLEATLQKKLVAGIHLLHSEGMEDKIALAIKKGYNFIALGSDLIILMENAERILKKSRQIT